MYNCDPRIDQDTEFVYFLFCNALERLSSSIYNISVFELIFHDFLS